MRLACLAIFPIALPTGLCSVASAQSDQAGIDTAVAMLEADRAGDRASGDEIVVTASRYGEAGVASESELGEEEIASHGAGNIQSLLGRLASLIDSNGQEPVILINGKPAGFDRSVLSYPTEALDRLAILKPEAAAQYGHSSGKRVVNLVLKKKFSSLNADAGVNWATAGGQYGGSLAIGRTAISGPTRWNMNIRIGSDSGLRKNTRNIPARAGVYDSVGFISGIGGGEIDPALSLATGQFVTVAAISGSAGLPTLADFITTANTLHAVDPYAFETLQPSRRNLSLGIGLTRPLGAFSASLNLTATGNSSSGMRGLPMAVVTIPAGHPWSPFANDIILTRPFAGKRVLRSENRSESVRASLTVNGVIDDWQTSFAMSYARSWGRSILENGVAIARLQQLIDAGDPAFNPYGFWDDGMLLVSRYNSRAENLSGRLNVQKNLFDLPAGPVVWNLSANASRNHTKAERSGSVDAGIATGIMRRQLLDGQVSLSVPVSRRNEAGVGLAGDLSVNLSISGQTMTNSRLQKRFAGDFYWSPLPIVQFRGSLEYIRTAPSFEQLDAPVITMINRIFDYSLQEMADAVWITGGNPDLGRGSQRGLALNVQLRPFDSQMLTLSIGYRQRVAKGGIASFPELTPAIEAAFPERVTRNAQGRLISVDARPINIVRDTDSELVSGMALRVPGQDGGGVGKDNADSMQLTVSLDHRWRLKNELLTRPGVPALDQLGRAGGQSRHMLSMQITAGKRGLGASLNASWSGAARLGNPAFPEIDRDFRLKPSAIFSYSMFIEPEHIFYSMESYPWMKNFRISFDIQNMFRGYRRITLDDGSVPPGYSRDEIDPLGRTVRVTVRKRF